MSAPDHWLTLCILAKSSRWSKGRLLSMSIITGLGHVTLSVLLGFAIVATGLIFSQETSHLVTLGTGFALLCVGLVYGLVKVFAKGPAYLKSQAEQEAGQLKATKENGIKYFALLGGTLSPDFSIIPIFLLALPGGLNLAMNTAIVFGLGSIIALCLFVFAGTIGLEKALKRVPPKYNEGLVGFVLAVVGAYIVLTD
jgi:nickel/cobalt exporter